jgi:hypothetical protein
MKARVWFSSSSVDTDVFAIVRLLDAEGAEIDFIGAHARVPVTLGWLRASQRKTDSVGSASYQQVYSNTEQAKLVPREEYPLDIEIWPSNIVVPVGYKLVLDIRGHDSQYPGTKRIHHTDAIDRPIEVFSCSCKVVTGGRFDSFLLLPAMKELKVAASILS